MTQLRGAVQACILWDQGCFQLRTLLLQPFLQGTTISIDSTSRDLPWTQVLHSIWLLLPIGHFRFPTRQRGTLVGSNTDKLELEDEPLFLALY